MIVYNYNFIPDFFDRIYDGLDAFSQAVKALIAHDDNRQVSRYGGELNLN
jgi:hypothetical protein